MCVSERVCVCVHVHQQQHMNKTLCCLGFLGNLKSSAATVIIFIV